MAPGLRILFVVHRPQPVFVTPMRFLHTGRCRAVPVVAGRATEPFRIMNLLEIVGDSMGLHHDDHFKRLKMLQDVDAIAADCQDLVAQHGLDAATTRAAIQAMLDEQPLPLRGHQ